MKTYQGDRTIDGIVVTVNGSALDPGLQAASFTDLGFEWSYEGPEPQQLALAILVDHLGDSSARVVALSKPFMQTVIARLDNTWQLTGTDIDRFLAGMGS